MIRLYQPILVADAEVCHVSITNTKYPIQSTRIRYCSHSFCTLAASLCYDSLLFRMSRDKPFRWNLCVRIGIMMVRSSGYIKSRGRCAKFEGRRWCRKRGFFGARVSTALRHPDETQVSVYPKCNRTPTIVVVLLGCFSFLMDFPPIPLSPRCSYVPISCSNFSSLAKGSALCHCCLWHFFESFLLIRLLILSRVCPPTTVAIALHW